MTPRPSNLKPIRNMRANTKITGMVSGHWTGVPMHALRLRTIKVNSETR